MCAIARPRTGAGTSAQAGWAVLAARQASTYVAPSASVTSATTSLVRDGFREEYGVPPDEAGRPAITELIVAVKVSLLRTRPRTEPGRRRPPRRAAPRR